MIPRITRARPKPLHADEALYAHAESHGRRWDDPPPAPAAPSKFRQRLAVVLVLVVAMAYVVVVVKLWGHR